MFLVDKVRSGRAPATKTPKVKRQIISATSSPGPSDGSDPETLPEMAEANLSVNNLDSSIQEALLYYLNQNMQVQPINTSLPPLQLPSFSTLPPFVNSFGSLDTFVGTPYSDGFADDLSLTAFASNVEAPSYFARQEGQFNQFSLTNGFTFDEPKSQNMEQLGKMMLY